MLPHDRRLGAHLPLARGMRKTVDRAIAIGAEALQIFSDNPTAWRRRGEPSPGARRFPLAASPSGTSGRSRSTPRTWSTSRTRRGDLCAVGGDAHSGAGRRTGVRGIAGQRPHRVAPGQRCRRRDRSTRGRDRGGADRGACDGGRRARTTGPGRPRELGWRRWRPRHDGRRAGHHRVAPVRAGYRRRPTWRSASTPPTPGARAST